MYIGIGVPDGHCRRVRERRGHGGPFAGVGGPRKWAQTRSPLPPRAPVTVCFPCAADMPRGLGRAQRARARARAPPRRRAAPQVVMSQSNSHVFTLHWLNITLPPHVSAFFENWQPPDAALTRAAQCGGPVVLCIFFSAGLLIPNFASLLWLIMFGAALLASHARFLWILRPVLVLAWLVLLLQLVLAIPALYVPPALLGPLGLFAKPVPFLLLLFNYSVPLLTSLYLFVVHSYPVFSADADVRNATVLTPLVQVLSASLWWGGVPFRGVSCCCVVLCRVVSCRVTSCGLRCVASCRVASCCVVLCGVVLCCVVLCGVLLACEVNWMVFCWYLPR